MSAYTCKSKHSCSSWAQWWLTPTASTNTNSTCTTNHWWPMCHCTRISHTASTFSILLSICPFPRSILTTYSCSCYSCSGGRRICLNNYRNMRNSYTTICISITKSSSMPFPPAGDYCTHSSPRISTSITSLGNAGPPTRTRTTYSHIWIRSALTT